MLLGGLLNVEKIVSSEDLIEIDLRHGLRVKSLNISSKKLGQ